MEKFINLKGVVAPFNFINIDTDKIIPKQFLKTIKRTGLGKHLFDDMRFNEDGSEKQDFVLNKEPYRSSKIIVAGDNFGCGSSREHAPWALSDFGIKCIISTSFADIFYNNSFKNGLLPIKVTPEQREALMADAKDVENPEIEIDLPSQEIRRPNGSIIKFELEPFRKKCLLEGLDDIDITLEKSEKINSFEATMELERPWL
ncbi:3-isopropylmalate dehydratase small subunit [Alphaproteobacteria bacterium]|jgi:3-isopropylmalate/(R)-2-methylmalate dehydratase small subunit|nr:3-isopropylmalate dehydratase small subunit [Alphaproteobacteria bacterium]|tara:strand:+ start:147 stop:752 length:606 start_codon:yes stop_codon:yes gene_type:complete